MYYDEGFYSRSFLLSSSFWIMLPKAQNFSHPAMNHFKETSNRKAWILNYIIISCFHTSSFWIMLPKAKNLSFPAMHHFWESIETTHRSSSDVNTGINQTKYAGRKYSVQISVPIFSTQDISFHFLFLLLSQRHTFKMKNSWWGRIPPLFNKWDLFLGILSPLSSFQTLITQFWNCRDRKVSLIPGFHRSKSNPHNTDTKLM